MDETAVQNRPYTARILSGNSHHVTIQTSYNPRERKTCFGFLDISGRLTTMLSDQSKKEDCRAFLEVLRARYASNITLVIILDNAAIHRSKFVREYCEQNNILLVHLPPYSPDLNPIEMVWRVLKKRIANRVSRTLDELVKRVSESLKSLGNMYSLCTKWVEKFMPSI